MKFSAISVLAAGSLGFVLGSAIMNERRPQVALAQSAAPARAAAPAQPANDGKLRIIIFGAHPDDAEYSGACVAYKWAKLGYHVKFVSATNGDIGHWAMAGGPLAERRKREVMAVEEKLGVTTEVLDNHDGELMPTLENRRKFARLIREWNADVVITHRPNDYHPDHRYTSILVQDSAYMVGVPFFTDVPPLKHNPIFLYAPDEFQHPYPFHADVAVGVDDALEPTVQAFMLMESQLQEGGADGNASLYPRGDEAARQRRRDQVHSEVVGQFTSQASRFRDALVKFYGRERAQSIHAAQAYEICEYGRRPSQEELKRIFPF